MYMNFITTKTDNYVLNIYYRSNFFEYLLKMNWKYPQMNILFVDEDITRTAKVGIDPLFTCRDWVLSEIDISVSLWSGWYLRITFIVQIHGTENQTSCDYVSDPALKLVSLGAGASLSVVLQWMKGPGRGQLSRWKHYFLIISLCSRAPPLTLCVRYLPRLQRNNTLVPGSKYIDRRLRSSSRLVSPSTFLPLYLE